MNLQLSTIRPGISPRHLLITLVLILCLPHLPTNAQCYDCMEKDKGDDWRFAAGITLLSNNPYQAYLDLPRKPLEFNFRYKIGDHHVLRMSLPIVVNLNLGEGGGVRPPYRYDEKKSLEDYYAQMKNEMFFMQHFQFLKNRYGLCGIALGYDYNHSIIPAFSVFGGVEVAYYHSIHKFNYCEIQYDVTMGNPLPIQVDNSSIFLMSYTNYRARWDVFTLKPLLGIRYQFQKLLFEASTSYALRSNGFTATWTDDYFQPNYNTSLQINDESSLRYGNQELEYQLSLYYTF